VQVNKKLAIVVFAVVGAVTLLATQASTEPPTQSTLVNLTNCSSTGPVKCLNGAQPSNGAVTFTPKGTEIVYYSNLNSPQYQIYKMKSDGTNRVNLTNDDNASHNWPKVSPDGSTILFYKAAAGKTVNEIETNSLWAMNADGTNKRVLIPQGTYGWDRQGHVEWSPDGSKLVMAAGKGGELHLFITDAQGKNPIQMTNRRNKVNNAHLPAIDPSWGPDGKTLMFIGCPDDQIFCFPEMHEVYRFNIDTKQETRLTFDDKADFDPYISPDGSSYVWLRCVGSMWLGGPWSLMKSSTSGAFTMKPIIDDGHINTNAKFSADGKTLLFGRRKTTDPGRFKIFSIGIDGQNLRQVSTDSSLADEGNAGFLP
jgi:Tol biopolymer transport system component